MHRAMAGGYSRALAPADLRETSQARTSGAICGALFVGVRAIGILLGLTGLPVNGTWAAHRVSVHVYLFGSRTFFSSGLKRNLNPRNSK